ncbi:MAG: hypothetical protein M1546_03220 [Chloroflexi bacterium]|nr:hypothetical protein [Chloroflexota bacterium]
METQSQAQVTPRTMTVTYGQVEAALKALPVHLLPAVYEYLRDLAEDAEDLATIDARQHEPTRPVEEFFAELESEEATQTSSATNYPH